MYMYPVNAVKSLDADQHYDGKSNNGGENKCATKRSKKKGTIIWIESKILKQYWTEFLEEPASKENTVNRNSVIMECE